MHNAQIQSAMRRLAGALVVIGLGAALSGCGGSKLLKEPLPAVESVALAVGTNDDIAVSLNQVIVQDGPGAWVKNAYWDEYRLSVLAQSADPVSITSIQVIDSLSEAATPLAARRDLVAASKRTKRRYRNNGVRLDIGAGGYKLAAGTAAAAALGAAAGATAVATGVALGEITTAVLLGSAGSGVAVASTPVIVASTALMAAPVAIVGGVIKARNNYKVDEQIQSRATQLPVAVAHTEASAVTVFLPIVPSPAELRISYEVGARQETFRLPLTEPLAGLHLRPDPE